VADDVPVGIAGRLQPLREALPSRPLQPPAAPPLVARPHAQRCANLLWLRPAATTSCAPHLHHAVIMAVFFVVHAFIAIGPILARDVPLRPPVQPATTLWRRHHALAAGACRSRSWSQARCHALAELCSNSRNPSIHRLRRASCFSAAPRNNTYHSTRRWSNRSQSRGKNIGGRTRRSAAPTIRFLCLHLALCQSFDNTPAAIRGYSEAWSAWENNCSQSFTHGMSPLEKSINNQSFFFHVHCSFCGGSLPTHYV
jgi:hypothetical protein